MHKIWVSDDDNAIRIILEESLSSSGFDVKTFSSGDDVVNELKNTHMNGHIKRQSLIRPINKTGQ